MEAYLKDERASWGTLTLPSTGPVYLDASGFIYSVERIEPYRTLLESMWLQAQAGQFSIVSSDRVVFGNPCQVAA